MKETYIRDLRPNQIVVSDFLVQSKELRAKKTGESYLSLALADKTGEVDAKMWENVEEFHGIFERDDFVKIKGSVQVFRNKPQITLYKLKRLEDREVDLADFFPRSARDPEEMWRELGEVLQGIGNPHLQALLLKIVSEPDVAARLKLAPAAKSLHHAYLGGLLEHILSVCRLAKLVVQNYSGIDLDLLLAGVILHDLGKIYELSYARSFSYTTEGQLLGHMMLELQILHRVIAETPDFPASLQTLLEHLIISHHGHYEFGSPKLPMFPEALMLHYLDDLDSKIQGMQGILERDSSIEGNWTGYLSSLGRPLLKMRKYLEESSDAALAQSAESGGAAANEEAPPGEGSSEPDK
jgi:3'-5' exoribonuclease